MNVNIVDRFTSLFLSARNFFQRVAKEGYSPSLPIALVLGVIVTLLSFVLGMTDMAEVEFVGGLGAFLAVLATLTAGVFIVIGLFIGAASVHLGVLFLRKKRVGSFLATFKTTSYGYIINLAYHLVFTVLAGLVILFTGFKPQFMPGMVFHGAMIPYMISSVLVSLIAFVHSTYAQVVGLMVYHKMSVLRALVAMFIVPLIIIIVITGGILMFSLLGFMFFRA